MTFPTVEQYNADDNALRFLGMLLSNGKNAPLYKMLVEETQLAPAANASQGSRELAGALRFRVAAKLSIT